ncbi:MAG: hypothetical protein AAF433_08640 [Bacteroidota bacterium]
MEKKSTTSSSPDKRVPDHLLGPLRSLYKWRRPILLASGGAFLLTALLSLLLPNYYTAETSFIALSPDQSSPEVLFGGTTAKAQLYGNADDIDRLLTLAESNELIDYLVDSFQLYQHYEIDPQKLKAPVLVRKRFLSLYDVLKTPRDAIEISVQDTDPELAANMATAARNKIDELSRDLQRSSQGVTMAALQEEIADKTERLSALDDSLAIIRERSGIYNHVAQSEALSAMASSQDQDIASVRAKISSYERINSRAARDSIIRLSAALAGLEQSRLILDSQLVQLNDAISPIENLGYERTDLNSTLNRDRDRMQQYQRAFNSEQGALVVIQEADIPVVKSWPRRSLLVIGVSLLVFIFSSLAAIAIDNSRHYDWKELLTEDD